MRECSRYIMRALADVAPYPKNEENNMPTASNTASNTPNAETIENVVVTVTEAQAMAIRKLAGTSSKLSASELADNLFAQVIRGRFKAKKENATAEATEKWNTAASIMGKDKMPMPLKQYVDQYVQSFYDILQDL